MTTEQQGAQVQKVVTSGTFSLDGGTWEVDNNVWVYGDEDEVVVIDAAHDAQAIATAVGGRPVLAIVCTHGHDDHIDAALDLARELDAPVWIHPDDRMLWDARHDSPPSGELVDGQQIPVAGSVLTVVHTPGHSPGGVCLLGDGVVFSGDTLFHGGPGATGRSFSDFPTILDSIREKLLTLPAGTVVHTGHGDDTTIGAEAAAYDEWVARGH
ncbi:MAG: MBL fold metallo-hydrolase [Pseudorhodobacter sp.]|nr:MBL fold metallo-hydrolase [Frankiaceae bacterium]